MISLKKLIIAILTDEPQLQSDIIKILAEYGIDISTRHLRENFKEINNDFIYGRIDFVVVSNVKGSYKSKAEEDIRKFNSSKIKHAKSELWSAYNINKRIEKNKNMSFNEFIQEELKGEING